MSASPLLKTPRKRILRYDENGASVKKRRSSLALDVFRHDISDSSIVVGHDLQGVVQEETVNRFVLEPKDHILPSMCTTPRTDRFAKTLNVIENQHVDDRCNRRPVPLHGFRRNLTKHLYEKPAPLSLTSAATNLVKTPEMTLTAPGIGDDFYSRPISWSSGNVLAVFTDYSINYRNMWNAQVGTVCKLDREDEPASIEWSPDAKTLAFGLADGEVRLLDAFTGDRISTVWEFGRGHAGGLSWNGRNLLSIGYGDGAVKLYDMRVHTRNSIHQVQKTRVCGLKWSPDGKMMAIGGGEGAVSLWDARAGREIPLGATDGSEFVRRWREKKHRSTVKAIAWCPWQSDVLATGGGTRDGTIRIWSTSTSKVVHEYNTASQISSIHFAPHCRELVSTHGYAFKPLTNTSAPRTHSILVHSYPSFAQAAKICDETHGRISDSCLSPDGTRIATSGGDETIRVYRMFGPEIKLEKEDKVLKSVIR